MNSPDEVAQWRAAANDPRVSESLLAIYAEAAEVVRRERPLCIASGRCCRFEEHGHRLFVTGLETAWFLKMLEEQDNRTIDRKSIESAQAEGTCPFLEDGLCSVHTIRPFGCRSYFCDPRAEWQTDFYEQWHARVRELHEELDLPYSYGEWRAMLEILVSGDTGGDDT